MILLDNEDREDAILICDIAASETRVRHGVKYIRLMYDLDASLRALGVSLTSLSLQAQLTTWTTPKKSDADRGGQEKRAMGSRRNLIDQAKLTETAPWRTPTSLTPNTDDNREAGLVKLTMWGYRCLRCGHGWIPRGIEPVGDGKRPDDPEEEPRVCPKCKSPYWNKPRKE